MRIVSETVYDISSETAYNITYDKVGSILSGDIPSNNLYFLDNYAQIYNFRDFIWVTDDNYIIEIDDALLKIIRNNDKFIDKMRELKTKSYISAWITYLHL